MYVYIIIVLSYHIPKKKQAIHFDFSTTYQLYYLILLDWHSRTSNFKLFSTRKKCISEASISDPTHCLLISVSICWRRAAARKQYNECWAQNEINDRLRFLCLLPNIPRRLHAFARGCVVDSEADCEEACANVYSIVSENL